jgi:hypothetical protein
MKYLFLIVAFFLGFTSAYAVKSGPVHSYSPTLINTISTKSAVFSNTASNVCCKPDSSFSFNKGNFLLVLAGCGIGAIGLGKYRGEDLSE